MKKIPYVLAGSLCFTTVGSFAQSVTLYGAIDAGVEYLSHANANGDKLVRMPAVTGSLPSRWGLRGTEDLGGGYTASFVLESGFNPRGGDLGQGGRLFGRQAWVGISGPFGTVSFGRQYTMTYVALLENDILGPDIYGLGSLDAYLPNGRTDNSAVYKKSLGPFTIGASYSFGRDSAGTGNSPGHGTCAGSVAGDFRQCSDWSAMLKYDAPSYGMVVSYEEQRGGTNSAYNFFDGVAPASLVKSGSKDTRLQANAYVNLLGAKIDGGWLGRRVDPAGSSHQVHSNLFYLGVSYLATPFLQLDGEAARILNRRHDTRATLSTIRATYHLSKRSAVYAQAAYLSNSAHARYTASSGGPGATPGAGMNQTGAMIGMLHFF